MRTRTRTVVSKWYGPWPSKGYTLRTLYCNGNPPASTSYTWPVENQYPLQYFEERMTDSLGKATPHGVVHRRKTISISEVLQDYDLPNAIGSNYDSTSPEFLYRNGTYYTRQAVESINLWNVGHDSTYPPDWNIGSLTVDEDVIKNDLLERARQLKADVLLNLVEANQSWPAVRDLATSLPNMARNWKSIRKVIKTASGAYLAWKFGVSPILSDIGSVKKFLPQIPAAFKKHSNQQMIRVSRSYRLPCSYNRANFVYGTIGGNPTAERRWQGLALEVPTVRYVLTVKPNTPPYTSDLFKALDFAMSRFASSPASLLWEKIPFSFVADWFVDLRGVCRLIDKCVGFEPFTIVNFSRSFSYTLTTQTYWIARSVCSGADLVNMLAGSIEHKHYERRLVPPEAYWPTWKPRFGKNQASISAALIGQRLGQLSAKR